MDRFQVGYAQPLLKDIFSEMNGYVSGILSAFGPIDQMKIGSKNARLDDTWLKIAYTGVPYHAEGPFHIDETGVYFDDIDVKDRYDGTGKLTGSINYEYFRNFTFDTRMDVNRIEGISLGENDNEFFYGSIFGTGNIHLTGPIESMVMSINAVTAKPGHLHVPLSSTSTSPTGSNLLEFKQIRSGR